MNKRWLLKGTVLCFILCLVIECFVYNYRFGESLTFRHDAGFTMSVHGLEQVDANAYRVTDPEEIYIELLDIGENVRNVYVNAADRPTNEKGDSIGIQIAKTDDANATYYELGRTEIVFGIEESKYIRTHLIGPSEKIKISFPDYEGDTLYLYGIGINELRPFLFLEWRALIVFLLCFFVWLFRPGSRIYEVPLDLREPAQRTVVIGTVTVNVLLFLVIAAIFADPNWREDGWQARLQYNYLAESFLQGHTYLNFEPPSVLAQLSNPYDPRLRAQALEEAGQEIITDFAYFNNRYYCYFGVVPVVLFYLPYLALTGEALSTAAVVTLFGCLFVVVSFWFMYTLVRRYFPRTSLGAFLLLSLVFVAACGVVYFMQRTTLYSLPIELGLFFDLLGVTCWLHASDGSGHVRKGWLAAGAFSIALVIGCRPQLAIAVLFAFPIFWTEIRQRLFFSRKGFWNTAAVIAPFFVVGLPVMYYNYVRFGNPMDFGAVYNLTGLDMTHRGIVPDRFVLGFYEYFLQPLRIGAKFPYFSVSADHGALASDYQGQNTNEVFMGGFFAYNLIGLFLFGLKRCRPRIRERGLWGFVVMSIVFALLIAAVDIQMVGITMRYLCDFSMFLMIPVIIILFAWQERWTGTEMERVLRTVVCCMGALCIFLNYTSLIAAGRSNSLEECSPQIFFKIKYQLCSVLSIR